MFEEFFQLRENPFALAPNPRFIFHSHEHSEALAHLRYWVENGEGFVLITGEVGTGKTTALFDLIAQLPTDCAVAFVANSTLTIPELLEEICRRFGLEVPPAASKPALLGLLEKYLSARIERGLGSLLILDEAQNFEGQALEEIRLLSNLERMDGKLIQIALVGQPELERKLARPELRQLRQRIGIRYRLGPLSEEETLHYLHHRITVAGGDATIIIPEATAATIHRLTHGIPREINIVASQALINAFVASASCVLPEHVQSVVDDFEWASIFGDEIPPPRARLGRQAAEDTRPGPAPGGPATTRVTRPEPRPEPPRAAPRPEISRPSAPAPRPVPPVPPAARPVTQRPAADARPGAPQPPQGPAAMTPGGVHGSDRAAAPPPHERSRQESGSHQAGEGGDAEHRGRPPLGVVIGGGVEPRREGIPASGEPEVASRRREAAPAHVPGQAAAAGRPAGRGAGGTEAPWFDSLTDAPVRRRWPLVLAVILIAAGIVSVFFWQFGIVITRAPERDRAEMVTGTRESDPAETAPRTEVAEMARGTVGGADPSAAPPRGNRDREDAAAMAGEPAAAPSETPPAVPDGISTPESRTHARPGGAGPYTIQLESFIDGDAQVVERTRAYWIQLLGGPIEIVEADVEGDLWHRVLFDRFASEEEARELLTRLKAGGNVRDDAMVTLR